MPDQVCLNPKCARQEHDSKRDTCRDCGGTLWFPKNVGGVVGNTNIYEAIKLIRAGKHPWDKP